MKSFKSWLNQQTYPAKNIPVKRLFPDAKEEDGYYHLHTDQLVRAGFLNDPSVFYVFSKPVKLTGDLADGIKLTSEATIKEKKAQIVLSEMCLGENITIEANGIDLHLCRFGKNVKLHSLHGPLTIERSHLGTNATLQAVHHPMIIRHSYIEGQLEALHQKVSLENSHIVGKIKLVHGNIHCGEAVTLRDSTSVSVKYGTRIGQYHVVEDSPDPLEIINSPAADPLLKTLNMMKKHASIKWVRKTVDRQEVYTTNIPVQNPQAVVFAIGELIAENPPLLPPKGAGKPSLSADTLKRIGGQKLEQLEILTHMQPATQMRNRAEEA